MSTTEAGLVPMVLVHGWGGTARSMAPVLALLDGHPTLAPQLPGRAGRASAREARVAGEASPNRELTDEASPDGELAGEASPDGELAGEATIPGAVRAVLRELECRSNGPSVLIGHSMGAQVTTAIHTLRPDLVAAEVVVDPAYGMPDGERAQVESWARDLEARGHVAADEFLAGAFTDQTPAGVRELVRADFRATPIATLVSYLRSEYLDDGAFGLASAAAPVLAARTRPTLALFSSERGSTFERRWAPRTDVQVAAGSGHFIHLERPTTFVALVRSWLARLPERSEPQLSHR